VHTSWLGERARYKQHGSASIRNKPLVQVRKAHIVTRAQAQPPHGRVTDHQLHVYAKRLITGSWPEAFTKGNSLQLVTVWWRSGMRLSASNICYGKF
jgi:hypothetical protein